MRKYPAIGLHFFSLFFSFLQLINPYRSSSSIQVFFSFSFEDDKPKNKRLLNNQNAILSTDYFHRFPSNLCCPTSIETSTIPHKYLALIWVINSVDGFVENLFEFISVAMEDIRGRMNPLCFIIIIKSSVHSGDDKVTPGITWSCIYITPTLSLHYMVSSGDSTEKVP